MMRPELTDALAQLANDVADAATDQDRERLIRLWQTCNDVIADMRLLIAECDRAAVPLMPGRKEQVVVDGIGTVIVQTRSSKTTWDHRRTAQKVMAAALDAGRIAHPNDAADVLLDAGAVSYWRVGKLKALGVDPDADELREVEPGTPALRLL
jgi:hypothetical protein